MLSALDRSQSLFNFAHSIWVPGSRCKSHFEDERMDEMAKSGISPSLTLVRNDIAHLDDCIELWGDECVKYFANFDKKQRDGLQFGALQSQSLVFFFAGGSATKQDFLIITLNINVSLPLFLGKNTNRQREGVDLRAGRSQSLGSVTREEAPRVAILGHVRL